MKRREHQNSPSGNPLREDKILEKPASKLPNVILNQFSHLRVFFFLEVLIILERNVHLWVWEHWRYDFTRPIEITPSLHPSIDLSNIVSSVSYFLWTTIFRLWWCSNSGFHLLGAQKFRPFPLIWFTNLTRAGFMKFVCFGNILLNVGLSQRK